MLPVGLGDLLVRRADYAHRRALPLLGQTNRQPELALVVGDLVEIVAISLSELVEQRLLRIGADVRVIQQLADLVRALSHLSPPATAWSACRSRRCSSSWS